MSERPGRICPVGAARSLDNALRRWLQNPYKMLAPHITAGMTVLDLGCGPGFLTLPAAEMVGPAGRVIACDLQEGMLRKVAAKIKGTALEGRIVLHRSRPDRLGVGGPVDFILAFYVVHELRDKQSSFREMASLLRADSRLLLVEPPLHVSRKAFEATVAESLKAGLVPVRSPRIFFSRAVLLARAEAKDGAAS